MARPGIVPGERPLSWVGSARSDLLNFPEAIKDGIGVALSVAQFGGKHPKAKPWKGIGPGVLEVVADHKGDTYRAVYTVKFKRAVYLLHAFPEEIAERPKDGADGCRTDRSKAPRRCGRL